MAPDRAQQRPAGRGLAQCTADEFWLHCDSVLRSQGPDKQCRQDKADVLAEENCAMRIVAYELRDRLLFTGKVLSKLKADSHRRVQAAESKCSQALSDLGEMRARNEVRCQPGCVLCSSLYCTALSSGAHSSACSHCLMSQQ